MEFRSQTAENRASSSPQPVAAPRFAGEPIKDLGGGGNKKIIMALGIAVAALLLLCAAWWGFAKMNSDTGIKKNQYQALFMTNGQVYFCKLSNIAHKYVKCTDIYYLQVQQSVQPEDKNKPQQPQVSLAKLGSELHGPEDEMQINREQVLFWENLKDDSKVVKAIKDNQKK